MTLHIVPTPIGNLEDISPRALSVLTRVRAVLCEDTRRTRILLSRYAIGTPLFRYDERDERSLDRILERLCAGEDMALTSDAGTPALSDPGLKLVSRARRKGVPVCALPGPFAAATAVSASGLPGDSFIFLGFLPRSPSRRRKVLAEAAALRKTLVAYESPFRVLDLLAAAEETLGPSAQAALARELTKVHEEWLTGTVSSVRAALASREKILGECVLVLHPDPAPDP
ncbi:MAG: 16S rRNA (cytidine(1402)-2'-O)-methyltransferase [Elusimicrobiota bacterium]